MVTPVLIALDFDDLDLARSVAVATRPHVGGYKVGLELLFSSGPLAVASIAELGLPVFADAKLHDIPNTVRAAARRLAAHGARWVTAHAVGGEAMLEAAVDGLGSVASREASGILAVTVLTSVDRADLDRMGISREIDDLAVSLALAADGAGAEGIVCSPRELSDIGQAVPSLLRVTPGIRPAGTRTHDQKRFATPAEALAAGADWLVVGRPITAAKDPGEAARRIAESLAPGP